MIGSLAGQFVLIGAIIMRTEDGSWPEGKVVEYVNDPARRIGRSKVNYVVCYPDDPACDVASMSSNGLIIVRARMVQPGPGT